MNVNGKAKGCKNNKTIENEIRNEVLALTIRELALPFAEDALNAIIELTLSDNPAIKLAASKEILDRSYGKPMQAIESKAVIAIVDVNPGEVARKAAFLLNSAIIQDDVKQIN